MILKEIGRPLIRFTAHEPVEVLETHPAGPLVEGSSKAVKIGRRVMVLTEPACGVAILLQDLANGGFVLCNDAVVARVASGLLGDHTKTRRVMVAAGDQRSARRRAECCRVELRVTQPCLCNAVQRRRWDHAAKGAADSIALVVRHDEQDVWRALRGYHPWRPPWLGIRGGILNHAAPLRVGWRQLFAADRGSGAGGSRFASGLYLCSYGRRNRHDRGSKHSAKEDLCC